ncbi:transporter substrate-binding domain-containing protein [Caballeronia glebae]|uniref:transporter substrate-binding domain-containing protein n=1 Tax=Caballeronia glebae TaxID=1777143 RepID=UPI0038B82CE3
MRWFVAAVMASVALSALPWRDRFGDDRPFAAAIARGTLIVAVPSRPAPTLNVGRVDHFARAPDGFAAALAENIGRRAGLPVVLLLATPAQARDALRTGRADVAIAELAFGADRELAYVSSAYTSGRGMALVLRHGAVRAYGDLAGRSICASRGNPFARDAARRAHANVQHHDRPLDALLAFQAGECAALVDDEYVIRKLLRQPDWAYYRALPGTLAPTRAFIATRGGDVASAAFVDRIVTDWRRQRWLSAVREDQATQLAFDMFNAQNDLYCH